MRRQSNFPVLLATVTAVGLGASNTHADENSGSWRLFDQAPSDRTVFSKAQTDERPELENQQALPKSRASSRWLVFNGIVSSSFFAGQVGEAERVETLWINGYPYQESISLYGVRHIKWLKNRRVLEVKLSNGLPNYLSPGERIQLDKEQ